MSDRKLTWDDVIGKLVRNHTASIRVCLPGKIESFDAEKQLAVVKPLLQGYQVDPTDPDESIQYALPRLYNVPVLFEGTQNFYFTYPIVEGDRCEIRFLDRSKDAWLQAGEDLPSNEIRSHDLTDAVCVMGLRDLGHKITEFDTTRPAMGKQGGPKISFSDDSVNLGGDHNEVPAQFAALANKVTAALNSLRDTMNQNTLSLIAHTHVVAGAAAAPSVSLVSLANAAPDTNVAASKVRVK